MAPRTPSRAVSPPAGEHRALFPHGDAFRSRRRRACARLTAVALLAFLLAACASAPGRFVPEPGKDYRHGLLHAVASGDTLQSVSLYYQRDMSLIAWLNDLRPPYDLAPGDRLYVPPDNTSRIVRDGTLSMEDVRALRTKAGGFVRVPYKRAVAMKIDVKTPPPAKRAMGGGPPSKSVENEEKRSLLRLITFRGRKKAEDSKTRPADASRRVAPPPAAPGAAGFAWPVSGTYVRGFTKRWPRAHTGVDVAAPLGTIIRAARDGVVLAAKRMPSYGNIVILDHGGGFSSVYAHNQKNLVRAGQNVSRGDPVAEVGETGNATGPHLHFEIRYNAESIDPESYLPEFSNSPILAENAR